MFLFINVKPDALGTQAFGTWDYNCAFNDIKAGDEHTGTVLMSLNK